MRWLFLILAASLAHAQTNLSLNVGPQCSIAILSATTTREGSGAVHGTTTFRYRIRASRAGGGGAITVVPDSGGNLSYDARLAGAGTGRTGTRDVTPAAAIPVAAFGPGARSSKQGDTGVLTWTLSAGGSVTLAIDCF
jgi:hypothetical protein